MLEGDGERVEGRNVRDAITRRLSAPKIVRSPPSRGHVAVNTHHLNLERIMVELKPIFKKAYWSLAAGGLLYVLCLLSLTFPEVQRLYVSRTYIYSERANIDNTVFFMPIRSIPVCGRMSTKLSNLDI